MKIQKEDKDLVIFESALYRTTTTLITREDYILLIDPNWLPAEIEFIDQYISRIDHGQKKYLLFTHSDYDHIIGYGQFKNYETIASRSFVNNKGKKEALAEIIAFDNQYYIQRSYEIEYPTIQIVISTDMQELRLKSDEYFLLLAPGHTKDGLVVWNKSAGILVVGDHLSNIEFPFICDSYENYKYTLEKIDRLLKEEDIRVLITGHGDHTTSREEMKRRMRDSVEYLEELEDSILNNRSFSSYRLSKRYQFNEAMIKSHRENMYVFRMEQGVEIFRYK